MVITVAVENSVAFPFKPGIRPGILGEHGLALILEHRGKKWLYDTGRGKALLPNLETLKIAPDDIDGVILSHAHLDHFGSLMDFLRARTKPVDVYMHEKSFVKRYTRIGDGYRPVGMPWSREELTEAGAIVHLNSTPVCLDEGLWLSGSVARENDYEQVEKKFFIDGANGEKQHDDIEDDQALFVECENKIVILTGCAHAGICNIVEAAKHVLPAKKTIAVLGGLHLDGTSGERLEKTMSFFREQTLDAVIVGHCTGFGACCRLASEFPDAFQPLEAGMTMTFN